MLSHLSIENIAIINKVHIDFSEGLNVLTGETGAGKSIIIDAINMILGERTSKELIRNGQDSALVEAVFEVESDTLTSLLESYGVTLEEDKTLLIVREMNISGKSICRINGRMVTASVLKEIAKALVNIHGQHDNQALLSADRHIEYLDTFGGQAIATAKDTYLAVHQEVKKIEKELNQTFGSEAERMQKLDMLSFQVNELTEVELKAGEEEGLIEQRDFYRNAQKLSEAVAEAYDYLYARDEGDTASGLLANAVRSLGDVSHVDKELGEIVDGIAEVQYQLEDKISALAKFFNRLEYDEEDVDAIEGRLDIIYRLKRKYGGSVDDLIVLRENLAEELDLLQNSAERREKLEKRLSVKRQERLEKAQALTRQREEAARKIEKAILSELSELDMGKVGFKVKFEEKDSFSSNGHDEVQFFISTNAGEPLKPLSKIASGGELSRIMLALKRVLADSVPTLIFDEIDTGISGRAAQKVGEKLSRLGRDKQVLCITHLPQIAAMADQHFLIEKSAVSERTNTQVTTLNHKKRVEEVARMLGGASITNLTLSHAEEMLQMAKERK